MNTRLNAVIRLSIWLYTKSGSTNNGNRTSHRQLNKGFTAKFFERFPNRQTLSETLREQRLSNYKCKHRHKYF